MRRHFVEVVSAAILSLFLFQGYQCGSPEFTGAKVHMQQKNFKEAIRLLEIEVQKNPTNEEAWFFLGGLKADEGDYDGMNTAFREALKLSNKHAAEIRTIRYNHWGQNLNAGVSFLEQAGSDSAHYFEKSIEAFNKSIKAWPDTALTYRYLGYAYNNKGDFDSAMEAFQKAWGVGRDVESIKRLGRIHLVKGEEHKEKFETDNFQTLRTLKNLRELEQAKRKSDVISLLGPPDSTRRGPRGTKKEDLVYKAFKLTVSVEDDKVVGRRFDASWKPPAPDSTEYRLAQREYVKAVETLETARDADPAAKLSKGMTESEITLLLGPPKTKTQSTFREASATLWAYEARDVQVFFSAGKVVGWIRPAPDNELLQSLLKAYIESNRLGPAIQEFERAVEDNPDSKTNHLILGVLYRTINRFDEAIVQFREALRLDPNDCDALFDLAATYYNWGADIIKASEGKEEQDTTYKAKFQSSLPYMEKVSECKKDDANVWETLGTIYARLGQQDKAIKAFEKADNIRKGN